MFGKLIKKINDFIQWTKKSYFWHPLISLNLGFVSYHTMYNLIKFGWDETWSFSIYGKSIPHLSFLEGIECFFIHIFLFGILIAPFAIFINIIAKILYTTLIKIKIIEKQPCCITNKFLLYNRWYNIYYITSFILLSLSFILFFIPSIISLFLSF